MGDRRLENESWCSRIASLGVGEDLGVDRGLSSKGFLVLSAVAGGAGVGDVSVGSQIKELDSSH